MSTIKEFRQTNWTGGLSESDLIGQKGSVIEVVGLDIFSEPNAVKISKKLTKEANSPTEVCKFVVADKFNNTYWFSSESGKVWYRTYAGVWSQPHTIAGASYYNGAGVGIKTIGDTEYIYYSYYDSSAGYDKLGYKKTVASGGAVNWSDAIDGWKSIGDNFLPASVHPMTLQQGFLVIGNSNFVATISPDIADSGASFTYNGTPDVSLPAFARNYEVSAISNFGNDVLIGASQLGANYSYALQDYSYAYLTRWDLTSDGLTSIKEISGNGIYNIQLFEGGAYVFVGTDGIFYSYDGTNLSDGKTIRTAVASQDVANGGYKINPKSVCNFGKYVLVGISKNSLYNETYNEGIYCLGRKTSSFPKAIALQYPAPCFLKDGSQTYNLEGITWGAMISIGNQFLVSYKDEDAVYGTTGVAILESQKRNPYGYLRLNITGNQDRSKTFEEYSLTYRYNTETQTENYWDEGDIYWDNDLLWDDLIPDLSLKDFFKNYNYSAAPVNFVKNIDDGNYNKVTVYQKIAANSIQPRINFVADITKDLTPVLTSFYCKWVEEEKL